MKERWSKQKTKVFDENINFSFFISFSAKMECHIVCKSCVFYITQYFFISSGNLFPDLSESEINNKNRIFKSNQEKIIVRLIRKCKILLTRDEMRGQDQDRFTSVGAHLDTLFSIQSGRCVCLLPSCSPNPLEALFEYYDPEDNDEHGLNYNLEQ